MSTKLTKFHKSSKAYWSLLKTFSNNKKNNFNPISLSYPITDPNKGCFSLGDRFWGGEQIGAQETKKQVFFPR